MAQIDTSFYRGLQGPTVGQGLRSVSGSLRDAKQSRMADLAAKQQAFNFEQAKQKAERAEIERKRKQAQQQEFMAQYQTAQMEGSEQVSPEKMQEIYANTYPQQFAEMQMKNVMSRDPNAVRRLDLQEQDIARKIKKDKDANNKFNQRQKLDYKKFLLSGEKSEEQIRQFEEGQKLKREEMDLELSKPDRERSFAQEGFRLQLPEYLQGKVNPKKVFVQTEVTKLKDANNSYGDIYKKVKDLETLVPSSSDYLASKGVGEKAGLVRSQVAQIITDYNRNVAELGALAGQDLTILEEAIPAPSAWKAMSYLTWKKTIQNLKKNIKEKYQGLMRNSEVNVSGNMLDSIADKARISQSLTSEEESWLD